MNFLLEFLVSLLHKWQTRESLKTLGATRSPQWNKVRYEFLQGKVCSVCGRKDNLIAHHKKPFHLFPGEELNPNNLIPLCERPTILNCHLTFGHYGNFKRFNPNIEEEAKEWRKKLQ